MSDRPRKHHYLPQFYLREWAGSDGRIERFDQPTHGKIYVKRVHTSQVGYVEHLYSAKAADDHDPEWLEREFLQKVDSAAALSMRKMNAEPPLPLSDLDATMWSIFVRSLYHRNPSLLARYLRDGTEHWERSASDIIEERVKGTFFENDVEFKQNMLKQVMENTTDKVLEHLPTILTSERVGKVLNALHKTVIDIPEYCPDFLISDALPIRTDGILVNFGHYAIPLSPRRLLVATTTIETMNTIKSLSPKQLVRGANEQTVGLAQHFVGARDRHQEKFIRNRFGILIKKS
jgi:hypothetical protein